MLEVSSLTGEGLATWFGRIASGELGTRKSMDVDYDEYADGEALLGWLNARVQLAAKADFDGNAFLFDLARKLRDRLASQSIEIAHLKMTLAPNEGPDLGAVSLTRTDAQPQVTHTLKSPLSQGTLVINLRGSRSGAAQERCHGRHRGHLGRQGRRAGPGRLPPRPAQSHASDDDGMTRWRVPPRPRSSTHGGGPLVPQSRPAESHASHGATDGVTWDHFDALPRIVTFSQFSVLTGCVAADG